MKSKNKLKVVIVGANGFIGKNLSFELSKYKSLEIHLISRKFDSFFDEDIFDRFNLTAIDYLDNLVKEIIKNADFVYFLVSTSVPSTSWNNPIEEINSNIVSPIKFFQKCIANNVRNIIYLSSGGAIYGKQKGELNEDTRVAPFSPYGISKLTIERYLEYFNIKFGLNGIAFRVSNVYGSNATRDNFGVINTWLKKIYTGTDKIEIYGSPDISKDYIYVNDVVNILVKTLFLNHKGYSIINMCSGETTSLNQIVNLISSITSLDFNVEILNNQKGDINHVSLTNSKLMELFPKFNFTKLEDGILESWNNLTKNND